MRQVIKEQLTRLKLKQIGSYIKRHILHKQFAVCQKGDFREYLDFDEKDYGGDTGNDKLCDTVGIITDVFIYANRLVFDITSKRLLRKSDNMPIGYEYIGETCSYFDINVYYIRYFDMNNELDELLFYEQNLLPKEIKNPYLMRKKRND